MRKTTLLTAAFLLLAANLAQADFATLKGQKAPEIEVSQWLNRPERTTIAAHQGEVLLIEFWATW